MAALYVDFLIHSFEVVTPLYQSRHDGQQLPIVFVIGSFSTCAFSSVEVARSENPETIVLVENAGSGEATWIGLNNNRLCQVEMVKNWLISKSSFELPKRNCAC
jgi:hypothetical protein